MAFRTRIEMRVMRGKRGKNTENRERESRRSHELRRDLLVAWDAIFINSARERERERERWKRKEASASAHTIDATIGGEGTRKPKSDLFRRDPVRGD